MGIHHLKEKIALLEHEAKTVRDENLLKALLQKLVSRFLK